MWKERLKKLTYQISSQASFFNIRKNVLWNHLETRLHLHVARKDCNLT